MKESGLKELKDKVFDFDLMERMRNRKRERNNKWGK